MNRNEWIDILREALYAEMPQSEIDNNIAYYRDYIDHELSNRDEQSVLDELGDPRLIAHTIIDTYKMQRGSGFGPFQNDYSGQGSNEGAGYEEYRRSTADQAFNRTYDTYQNHNMQYESSQDPTGQREYSFHVTSLKWYHKVLIAAIIVLLLIITFFLAKIVFYVLLRIGIPVLCVYLIYSLFKRH